MQLLVRHPRKVVPTDAGRAFHEHCDALISHVNSRLEAASTEVQGMSSGGTGRLCILSDNQFLTTFVCHMVRHFLERYANIACELHVSERADSPGVKEVDSSGLWLMPAFSPRTKSMAWGSNWCIFIASWPAPLGIR